MILSEIKKRNRWLIGCLFWLYACHNNESNASIVKTTVINDSIYQCIQNAQKLIHSGDIITRTGNDFTSYCLRKLNQRDKTFSHCGIASVEHDSVFVYHAIGGDFNPDQKIKRETFGCFVDPNSNNGFGIFRLLTSQKNIESTRCVAKDFYRQEIKFDMDFDVKNDDRMYCAEFVAKSIEKGNNNAIRIPLSHIRDFVFIGVDDITLSKSIEKIFCRNYFNP